MAISTYGDLKAELSAYMFHQRFVARYDNCTGLFERAANRRLRVRQMEAAAVLTTVNGDILLPADYLAWRTIKTVAGRNPAELEYVHPAYLLTAATAEHASNDPQLFAIEGNLLRVRPANDAETYELHYYQKIPTLAGNDLNSNWLLRDYPDAYQFGLLTELAALGRNADMAQLYKARRDEVFAEIIQLSALTTGATSPQVRTGEYY